MNIELLKALKQINNGVVLKKGQQISTISPESNIYVRTTEVSDIDFGIYDINTFLGAATLISDTNRVITVSSDNAGGAEVMEIKDDKSRITYVGAPDNLITTPPEDVSSLTDLQEYNEFAFSGNDIKTVLQSCSIMSADTIKFVFSDDKVTIKTIGRDEDANTFEVSTGCNVDNEGMEASISRDTLKVIIEDYTVTVTEKALVFKNADIVYYIVRSDLDG